MSKLRQLREWRSDEVSIFNRLVTLPEDRTPRFPDHCVLCGVERPTSAVRLSSATLFKRTNRWFWNCTPVRWLWPFGRLTVSVPCCPPCAVRIQRYDRVRFWAFTTALVVTVVVVGLVLSEYARWHLASADRGKLAWFLAILPLTLAFGIDGLFLRLPGFFVKRWYGLEFSFPSLDEAIAFFELNRSAPDLKPEARMR